MRWGTSIVVAGQNKANLTKQWLAAVDSAKTEADLHALVRTQQINGLVSVTTFIKGVTKVTTWWSLLAR